MRIIERHGILILLINLIPKYFRPMTDHYITWWNVENLFDVKDAPESRRPPDIARKIKADLTNWAQDVLDRKIQNLASVIMQINNGLGPDLLGVCEIENAHVLNLLVQAVNLGARNYQLIHHDTLDNRGIDVAFIYDANKYQFNAQEFFHHEIVKRYPTREIVQATIATQKGNEIILVGNHWPSRSGGQYESEPYRIIAGETLSYFIERIQQVKGNDAAILVMGDFNDEPFNRSLMDYAQSVRDRDKVVNGRNPYLLNLMWPVLGERNASYVFDGRPIMLDQFLVSKGIVKKTGKFDLSDNAKLEKFAGMVSGDYDIPVRFGQETPNLNGFSDHLPISFVLQEK
jgi:predicted extracellular nuclease